MSGARLTPARIEEALGSAVRARGYENGGNGAYGEINALKNRPACWFHGPGEGQGVLRALALEGFPRETNAASHAASHDASVSDVGLWVTEWESAHEPPLDAAEREMILNASKKFGLTPKAWLFRPLRGVPEPAAPLSDAPDDVPWITKEAGVRYEIVWEGVRHPGLFLDHAPLRHWLKTHGATRLVKRVNEKKQSLRILNLFSYTASLSLAVAHGLKTLGITPEKIISVDLSKATQAWARRNWFLNFDTDSNALFIAADAFEVLKREIKRGEGFDLILSDPPSFSRTKGSLFSTQNDLGRLHEMCVRLLRPQGILVSSVNSAKISRETFDDEFFVSAARAGVLRAQWEVLERITLSTEFLDPSDYLKGLILERRD